MTDIKKALHDPSACYKVPDDVVNDETISRDQKINVLRQWEYDSRLLQVAEEENMVGSQPSMLNRVHIALQKLGAASDPEHTSPAKHGGGKIFSEEKK